MFSLHRCEDPCVIFPSFILSAYCVPVRAMVQLHHAGVAGGDQEEARLIWVWDVGPSALTTIHLCLCSLADVGERWMGALVVRISGDSGNREHQQS